jgi:REP element-mobilizing transposase RayT
MRKRSRTRKVRLHQRTFDELGPGGKRKGAGRKPKGEKAGVAHRPRAEFKARFPVHVTIKLMGGLPSLRHLETRDVILDCLERAKERFGMRVIHFSVQTNHIHLIIEAEDRDSITRGMKGLQVRFARNMNRHWSRRGRVFADRFHDHVLRTPREVRNAIAYVLHNSRQHGVRFRDGPDPYSSGQWFPDWIDFHHPEPVHDDVRPISPARTWLARVGWRRHGAMPPCPMIQ